MNELHLTRRAMLAGSAGAALASEAAYPIYRCSGAHRELGRQHGEQAAERIRAHVEHLAESFRGKRELFRARALSFVPLFEQHCPHLVDEIRGLAEGAAIHFAEGMACNIRGEIGRAPAEGCTAYAVGPKGTSSGQILIGQNSDLPARMLEFAYVLHLKPPGKPQVMIWTFGGMIGYHGMNSAGVAHFANALGGGPGGRMGLPHYPVKRLMLECRDLREVLSVLERSPLASNGNYVLCDGAGEILDVEATTEGPQILRDQGRGFIAHTNHYLCPRYATRENHERSLKDSFPRLSRMDSLLTGRMGQLSVADLKRFLSDHSNGPRGICRHQNKGDSTGCTVASIVAEPGANRMQVAAGNPCRNPYTTYSLEM
ncbi:MAG: C45 family peptidase [Bryobacteraceae bacterium]